MGSNFTRNQIFLITFDLAQDLSRYRFTLDSLIEILYIVLDYSQMVEGEKLASQH